MTAPTDGLYNLTTLRRLLLFSHILQDQIVTLIYNLPTSQTTKSQRYNKGSRISNHLQPSNVPKILRIGFYLIFNILNISDKSVFECEEGDAVNREHNKFEISSSADMLIYRIESTSVNI